MNGIINKFSLAGDKFISETHLRQPGLTYSTCRSFTKNKERIQKIEETGYSRYTYQNELDKACFQHDMAYGDFKDLPRRTASDKVMRDKSFNIAKKLRYDGNQRGLASMLYKFFDKNPACSAVKNEIMQNEKLAQELYKIIIKNLKKKSVLNCYR